MVQNILMRTSVSLDEDVYEIATLYAKGRGVTLGAALGEMVRKATSAPTPTPPRQLMRAPNGLLIAGPSGRVITSEMVKAALEDEIE